MTIEKFQCARHSLVSVIGSTMVGPGGGSQKAGKRYFEIGFANAVLHTIAILLMLCRQNSQRVRCTFLRIQSLLWAPPRSGPKKKVQSKASQMAQKRYFEIDFCKYSIS